MSLIRFHRVLIGTGIVFCFAFAGWELIRWWVGGPGSVLLGGTFVGLGALLVFYLGKLDRFLGYEDDGPSLPRELGDAE